MSFAGSGWPDAEHNIVLRDRMDVIPLPERSRDNRRLTRRGRDLHVDDIGQIVRSFFRDRVEGVIELVLLNINAFTASFHQLVEHPLRAVDFVELASESYPP